VDHGLTLLEPVAIDVARDLTAGIPDPPVGTPGSGTMEIALPPGSLLAMSFLPSSVS